MDKDLQSRQEARELLRQAESAQRTLAGFSQEKLDAIAKAVSQAFHSRAEELAELAKRYFDEAYPASSVEEAITNAKKGIGKLKGMCVCGSLYLAGDARKILLSDVKN